MGIDRSRNQLTATVDVHGRLVNRWKRTDALPTQRMSSLPALSGAGSSSAPTNVQMVSRIAKLMDADFLGTQLEVAQACTHAYYEDYVEEFSYEDDLDYAGITRWVIDTPLPKHEAIREPDEDDEIFGTYDEEELEEDYGSERWVGNFEASRGIRRAAYQLTGAERGIGDPHVFVVVPGHTYEGDSMYVEDLAHAFCLLTALQDAEEVEVPLYRSTHMSGSSTEQVLAQLTASTTLDMPLLSTSDGADLAEAFGTDQREHYDEQDFGYTGGVVVRYVIEPGAQAIAGRKLERLAIMGGENDHQARQTEYLTGGRFEVLDAQLNADDPRDINVRLRQVQTFGPMGGN